MDALREPPKGYRFSKTIISYAVYLYHRFLLSYRDVQELLFERGIDVSHETVRVWWRDLRCVTKSLCSSTIAVGG